MNQFHPGDSVGPRGGGKAKAARRLRGLTPTFSSAPPGAGPQPALTRLFYPGLVLLLALVAFGPTLGNGFPFDDERLVVQNRLITSVRYIPLLLTRPYGAIQPEPGQRPGSVYRPLLTSSFALNYALGGLNPVGYHAVNLLLHAAVSLAVYGLGRRLGLTPGGACVAGALFAVHPLHTEAVASVVGRAELLMALGVLLALAGYGAARRGVRLGSLAAFALGCLGKEQAMVLPALLFLTELHTLWQAVPAPPWRAAARGALRRLLPYVGILVAYLFLRAWALGGLERVATMRGTPFMDNPLFRAPTVPRLLTALAVAGRYLLLMLWPVPLSPDYSYNQISLVTSLFDGRILLASLLWGSLVLLAAGWVLRGRGIAGFAAALTLVTFLPASNLVVLIGTIMGERLFYLPSVGLCWLAGLAWQTLRARAGRRLQQVMWALVGVLLAVLAAQSLQYGRIWHDNDTLFTYAVQVVPDSAKVRFNLGSTLLFKGRKDEAIVLLRRAVAIYPAYLNAWDALGRGYLDTKQWDAAIAAFQKALTLAPDYPHSHNNLGLAYMALGRWEEAMVSFRHAVASKPDLVQAHRNLANVYDKQGRTEAALAERALELNPADPLAWLEAGSIYWSLEWSTEALGAFRQALRLDPKLVDAHLRLARAYDALGRPAEAAQAYEALLRLRPNLPAVHRRLAELYTTQLRDPVKAQIHLRRAEGVRENLGTGQ